MTSIVAPSASMLWCHELHLGVAPECRVNEPRLASDISERMQVWDADLGNPLLGCVQCESDKVAESNSRITIDICSFSWCALSGARQDDNNQSLWLTARYVE
eukprot:5932276-Amphidinium_carterae.1